LEKDYNAGGVTFTAEMDKLRTKLRFRQTTASIGWRKVFWMYFRQGCLFRKCTPV